MEPKIVRVVCFLAMVLNLTALVCCLIGLSVTGFYPGIVVILLLALIPIVSKFWAKKMIGKSGAFQRNFYKTVVIVNLFSILVVLWMTFVITIDRIIPNCCWQTLQ